MTTKAFLAWLGLVGIVITVMVVVGLTTLHRMVTKAEDAARAERDAHWSAEIAKSNVETEKRLRLQTMAAVAADTAARDKIAAVNLKLEELEKANDALPDTGCGGLGRDRVELLFHGPK